MDSINADIRQWTQPMRLLLPRACLPFAFAPVAHADFFNDTRSDDPLTAFLARAFRLCLASLAVAMPAAMLGLQSHAIFSAGIEA